MQLPMTSLRFGLTRGIVAFVSLAVMITAGRTIYELKQQQNVLKTSARELEKIQGENVALERTLQDMQSDSYVERIARDKLGMVKEEETIVILDNPESITQNLESGKDVSNWRKWWGLFF